MDYLEQYKRELLKILMLKRTNLRIDYLNEKRVTTIEGIGIPIIDDYCIQLDVEDRDTVVINNEDIIRIYDLDCINKKEELNEAKTKAMKVISDTWEA